jgi:signal transduction histidine kinase
MVSGPGDNSTAQDGLSLTERELFDRLAWFIHIRWFMGLLALMLLLVAWSILGVRFRQGAEEPRLSPAADAVLVIFLYNALFTFLQHIVSARRRITRPVIMALALGQIACDILAVCGLVHFTGGVENYFIILILLPLVIAAELLPVWLAYTAALAASALVHAMAYGELWGVLPHVSIVAGDPGAAGLLAGLHTDVLYVAQVTGALTAMMFMIVFIGSAIASRLRGREAQLEDAYRQLSDVDEAKGLFMRQAGHEMRSPLAAMFSILDAISGGADNLSDDHLRLIDRAKRRIRALMELVRDLRRYSWLRSPAAAQEMRMVCLEELVDAAVELFGPQAEARDVSLTAAAQPARVRGDEEMLREAVTNLVSNAIQYTPRGGRIEIDLAIEGTSAVLRVADTGIGVSDEARGQLFQEFYRSPEARKHFPDGTGLGLAITRRIVELHGGRIEVQSRPEGGTLFLIRLAVPANDHGAP